MIRPWASRIFALTVLAVLFRLAPGHSVPDAERKSVAARFRFSGTPLPVVPGPQKHEYGVHPKLAHIASWISAGGAAVALADLDGDGLPNDVCHSDPRTGAVLVFPAPGTPARYAPIRLDPAPLRFSAKIMAPSTCLPIDLNEDGRMDLVVTYAGRIPIAFFRQGDHYVPRELIGGEEVWFTSGAILSADVDGDGHLDLVVANYFRDGDRILDSDAPPGDTVEMPSSMSKAFNGGRTHFLRWVGATGNPDPSVHFEEAFDVIAEEVSRGWTLAIAAGDLDGDLLPELYLANDFGPDRLLHNRSTPGHIRFAVLEGKRGFTDLASTVLGRDSFHSMGVDMADMNRDGYPDIYVSNINSVIPRETHCAFMSTGDVAAMQQGRAPYVDRAEELGLGLSDWAWDVKLSDFDNDGSFEVAQAMGMFQGPTNRLPELEELVMANDQVISNPASWPRFRLGDDVSGHAHNAFFARLGERYVDIAPDLGLDTTLVTRGIAVADVDGDGDLDFATANQWSVSHFYENQCPQCGAFVGLHLRLPLSSAGPTVVLEGAPPRDLLSRPAVGASAAVHTPDGRKMVAQVDGGNGHSGKRSPDLHFGLGKVSSKDPLAVDLRWRDQDGQPRSETIRVTPGWHTIVLGKESR